MARQASSKPNLASLSTATLRSKDEIRWQRADDEVRKNLPPGVKLLRTLRGHTGFIGRIAWSPDGQLLASPSHDQTIRLWDANTGECLRTLEGHRSAVWGVDFHPMGQSLASGDGIGAIKQWDVDTGSLQSTVNSGSAGRTRSLSFQRDGNVLACNTGGELAKLWDVAKGTLLRTLADNGIICDVMFLPDGGILATANVNGEITIWDANDGAKLRSMKEGSGIAWGVTFDSTGRVLASSHNDRTVKLWDVASGRLLRILEGHVSAVEATAFSSDGRVMASKGKTDFILWNCETWKPIWTFAVGATYTDGCRRVAFHPSLPVLATVGTEDKHGIIQLWKIDLDLLLGQQPAKPSVSYTSAKVVLVGDSGVGKTGLGWRLAHGEFKEHASTHGQQFWLLDQLCKKRADGTECEAVLWDLAGQPDYRLIHALFLDDADLALVLFDPTKEGDPLAGVEFWLRQLKAGNPANDCPPIMLVAARSDRGTPRLTSEELEEFCQNRCLSGYFRTSAKAGEGIEDLLERMKGLIPWDEKPATVTTETFKRIKDYVLELKENRRRRKIILTPEELRERLMKSKKKWQFTEAAMLTAVGHLANHGYVTKLKTSQGESRILLSPELLNNLAASLVLEARRNVKGLGSLEEQKLLAGQYKFPELDQVTEAERDLLLDAAAVLFLEHNVCFRETNPNNMQTYLVFPELINLKRPADANDKPIEDGAAYSVSGAIENVYASLVVLMGYTQTFTRTSQWRNQARYEVGNKQVCGFRLEDERPGELDFVLYFSTDTAGHTRTLFQSLFEGFLARRSHLEVKRFDPVQCSKAHRINRAVVREQLASGEAVAFCGKCGEKVKLPKGDGAIHLTAPEAKVVQADQRVAHERSRFEKVLFRLNGYVKDEKLKVPECFISYAWGDPAQELWVEKFLAMDLRKAGIKVLLDRWHNQPGSDIQGFVDRLEKVDRIVVVGTKAYRKKYDNEDPKTGTVVAAECAQISARMRGTKKQKTTVVPLLRDGTQATALPPCLHGQVFCDFRKDERYFTEALGLLLSLYGIAPDHAVAVEMRDSLQ